MKTAEEVLRPYMPIINNRHRSKTDIRETIIHIMEEYANARLQELSLTDEEIQKWAKEVVIKKEDNYSGLDYMILAAKWARNKLTGK